MSIVAVARRLFAAVAVVALLLVGPSGVGTATAAGLPAAGTAAPVATTAARSLLVEARLDGYGPVSSWVGGPAKRELILLVTNTSLLPIVDPAVTITGGSGGATSEILATPKIGTVTSNKTIEYRLPITIKAFAFGTYEVTATFIDLDDPLSVTASTSTYPWILIGVGIVLLQPLLLGLYKRRPAQVESVESDELVEVGPRRGSSSRQPGRHRRS